MDLKREHRNMMNKKGKEFERAVEKVQQLSVELLLLLAPTEEELKLATERLLIDLSDMRLSDWEKGWPKCWHAALGSKIITIRDEKALKASGFREMTKEDLPNGGKDVG